MGALNLPNKNAWTLQRDIDTIGTAGIIERIREVVGDNLVYLSIDIDVLDPAFAPATGTPEVMQLQKQFLQQKI